MHGKKKNDNWHGNILTEHTVADASRNTISGQMKHDNYEHMYVEHTLTMDKGNVN